MHPSKCHQSMTAAPSSGLRFGFVDVNRDVKARDEPSGANQATPSKSPLPASPFTFRIGKTNDGESGLGPDARRMMEELREDAAKIKAELVAKREQERMAEAAEFTDGRKFAKPKGKAGRYSDIHMAEFKKMDSIANHPSAFRATPARTATVKQGLKRSQSRANLDEPETVSRKIASVRSVQKSPEKQREEPESPLKRIRQRIEDDVSTLRPVSRDGSSIPRPKSSGNDSVRTAIPRSQTLGNIMTPTKASVARAAVAKVPTIMLVKSPSKTDLGSLARSPSKPEFGLMKSPSKTDLSSLARPSTKTGLGLVRSPSKPDLGSLVRTPSKKTFGGLKRSATINNLDASDAGKPTLVQTPGRFDRVKSILKRQFSASKPKSGIPHFATSIPKTPSRADKELPLVPVTTPGRRFGKHVDFTPDTKQAALTQNSPSPTKMGIIRSKTLSKLPTASAPPFETVNTTKNQGEVLYPDLPEYHEVVPEVEQTTKATLFPASVPGTFTFRSDHTIRFNNLSPNGFGGAAGQASLRHVGSSDTAANRMPGSFPAAFESGPTIENTDPALMPGIPHGMLNKKRHRGMWDDDEVKTGIAHGMPNKKRARASSDDDDEVDEGVRRGAKKLRKNPTAEGYAVVAPRLVSSSPIKKSGRLSRTPSPQKKTIGLSLSRLNMLARPKARK